MSNFKDETVLLRIPKLLIKHCLVFHDHFLSTLTLPSNFFDYCQLVKLTDSKMYRVSVSLFRCGGPSLDG